MERKSKKSLARFEQYLEKLAAALAHADRAEPCRAYLAGLLLPGERKSVEPMAARVDPRHTRARHQSMHHFVAHAPWDDRALLRAARDYALSAVVREGGRAAWVVDDTGLPKQGKHSVGVARQYCGALGKQANCQVAVSISLVSEQASLPCAYRLYLPEEWAGDKERREAVGVPKEVCFTAKLAIALEEIDRLLAAGVPPAPVLADAWYGDATEFREGLTARGLSYAVGIRAATTVWPPGVVPQPPPRKPRRGRPPSRLRRRPQQQPQAVRTLAPALPAKAWRTVCWREGSKGAMKSRFAAVRVRPAHRDYKRREPRAEEWLLIEWPKEEAEPAKYWLSTLPSGATLQELVYLVKLRWRIERDYEELKDELGLDHFEGRNWRGFHHHAALCIAAYAFLIAERARPSPPEPSAFLKVPALPEGFRPRGSPAVDSPAPAAINCLDAADDRPRLAIPTPALSSVRGSSRNGDDLMTQ